ncbi:MAG: phosphate ABC transporter permease subunit PstC [Alphaproteobacteria bacterium]|nr:phosphate ABC transporter permease subunit PstC [Alphaproteobacteria bacterium]
MSNTLLIAGLLLLMTMAYVHGRRRALSSAAGRRVALHSLPSYHGLYIALWCGLPALALAILWLVLEPSIVRWMVVASLPEAQRSLPSGELGLLLNDVRNLAPGNVAGRQPDAATAAAVETYRTLKSIVFWAMVAAVTAVAAFGFEVGRRAIAPAFRARQRVERTILWLLVAASTIAVLTTIGIVLSLVFESARFFDKVSPFEFLFGLEWSPQTALREGQVGSSGTFGAVPVFAGTLMITIIAMTVAVPVGLMSAIYLAEYASPRVRAWAKPLLEVLAGIPTVVYGFFAALTMAPAIRELGTFLGIEVASESALAAGIVMGVMIIPFVSSLSDDVINAVPQTLRDGSLALGATHSETVIRVVLPAALPGIVGSVLLAVSRAIGETMIVVMAAGLSARLTANPFDAVTTVTVQIVSLLVGDQEFDSAKTLAAFALGLLLFVITLGLNVVALTVVRKYREMYD